MDTSPLVLIKKKKLVNRSFKFSFLLIVFYFSILVSYKAESDSAEEDLQFVFVIKRF